MPEITILAVRPVTASVGQSGSRVLAGFDFEVAGVQVRGCVLVLNGDGDHIARMPRMKSGSTSLLGMHPSAGIRLEAELQSAVKAAAVAAVAAAVRNGTRASAAD